MDSYFIDATIFLRYLTADDSQTRQACLHLFQQAEQNQVSLITSEGVTLPIELGKLGSDLAQIFFPYAQAGQIRILRGP